MQSNRLFPGSKDPFGPLGFLFRAAGIDYGEEAPGHWCFLVPGKMLIRTPYTPSQTELTRIVRKLLGHAS